MRPKAVWEAIRAIPIVGDSQHWMGGLSEFLRDDTAKEKSIRRRLRVWSATNFIAMTANPIGLATVFADIAHTGPVSWAIPEIPLPAAMTLYAVSFGGEAVARRMNWTLCRRLAESKMERVHAVADEAVRVITDEGDAQQLISALTTATRDVADAFGTQQAGRSNRANLVRAGFASMGLLIPWGMPILAGGVVAGAKLRKWVRPREHAQREASYYDQLAEVTSNDGAATIRRVGMTDIAVEVLTGLSSGARIDMAQRLQYSSDAKFRTALVEGGTRFVALGLIVATKVASAPAITAVVAQFAEVSAAQQNHSDTTEAVRRATMSAERLQKIATLIAAQEAAEREVRSRDLTLDRAPSIQFDRVVLQMGEGPKTTTLGPVSFRIPAGSTAAVIGRNGSGKTSVAKALLSDPSVRVKSGRILVNDIDIATCTRASLARAVAGASLVSDLIFPAMRKLQIPNGSEQFSTAEQSLGLTGGSISNSRTASTGQRRRAAAAAYVLSQTSAGKIIVADEPDLGADPESTMLIYRALGDALRRDDDRTSLLVSQQPGALKIVDYVVMLGVGGHVLEEGSKEDLLGNSDSATSRWKMTFANVHGLESPLASQADDADSRDERPLDFA